MHIVPGWEPQHGAEIVICSPCHAMDNPGCYICHQATTDEVPI